MCMCVWVCVLLVLSEYEGMYACVEDKCRSGKGKMRESQWCDSASSFVLSKGMEFGYRFKRFQLCSKCVNIQTSILGSWLVFSLSLSLSLSLS